MSALSTTQYAAIAAHAAAVYPREACGVLVEALPGSPLYIACTNIAASGDQFEIDPAEWASLEDRHTILAIVHSHPNASANPSEADVVGCEKSGLPWAVIGWPSGVVRWIEPKGYEAPLIGRTFYHGVLDCYTLVRDYYARECDIQLPDYSRSANWWVQGLDLYLTHAAEAGFAKIPAGETPRKHDVALMRIRSKVPNHAAVMLGDGTMVHHLMNRLSTREVFGGWYERVTVGFYRHNKLA